MRATDRDLSETDIWPEDAALTVVKADTTDQRQFLRNAALCPGLANLRIRHLAIGMLPSPFRIVRTNLGGSYFLACHGGEGRVLADGRWRTVRRNQAVLLPPATLQAFQTAPHKTWEICWVRYQEVTGQKPLAALHAPMIAGYAAEGLRLAILGLHQECTTDNSPPLVQRWLDLVQSQVERFLQRVEVDRRLWQMWSQVAEALAHPWTSAEMSRIAHLGEKQLQRLCRRELGRTPRQQLIWLRMRKAAELLTTTNHTVDSVAAQVGYANPFVFSTTFKRVMGWSPSAYPGRK